MDRRTAGRDGESRKKNGTAAHQGRGAEQMSPVTAET
jgi:hypothetical protein